MSGSKIPAAFFEDMTVTAHDNGDVAFKSSGSAASGIASGLESVTFHLEGNATLQCRDANNLGQMEEHTLSTDASEALQDELVSLIKSNDALKYAWNRVVPYENLFTVSTPDGVILSGTSSASITYENVQTGKGTLGDLNPIKNICSTPKDSFSFTRE